MVKKKPKRLTPQLDRFCREFVRCGVASEAYRIAYPASMKYADASVWSIASRTLKNPLVEERVRILQEEARKNSDVSKQEVLNLLRDIIRGQQVPDHQETTTKGKRVIGMSRSWAVERLCKMLGFDTAVEVNLIGSGDSRMTDEEILNEINRLEKLG